MRPLYLDGKSLALVEWDHAALKLIAYKKSPQWVPLHKISHITVFNQLDWQGEALTACMEAGVSISFSGKDGYIGYCSGNHQHKPHLHSQLVQLFILRNEKLDDWFNAQQSRRLDQLHRRFHLGKYCRGEALITQQLDQRIAEHYHYYRWQSDLKVISGMQLSQLYLLLPYYGFSQSQLQQNFAHQQLLKNLQTLVRWEYWQFAAQGNLPRSSQNKHLVRYFHQHQLHTEKLTRYYINALWDTLTEA